MRRTGPFGLIDVSRLEGDAAPHRGDCARLAYFLTVAEVAPQMVPVALSTARHSRVDA
jgi:hypothetical protein